MGAAVGSRDGSAVGIRVGWQRSRFVCTTCRSNTSVAGTCHGSEEKTRAASAAPQPAEELAKDPSRAVALRGTGPPTGAPSTKMDNSLFNTVTDTLSESASPAVTFTATQTRLEVVTSSALSHTTSLLPPGPSLPPQYTPGRCCRLPRLPPTARTCVP